MKKVEANKLIAQLSCFREASDRVTAVQMQVFTFILSRDESNPREIAEELDISTPRVVQAIDQLLDRKMIDYNFDPADRRNRIITPTASGRKFIERVLG